MLQVSFQHDAGGLFTSVCLSSEQESRVATRRFARKVQKLGFPVSFLDFMIQTVSGTFRTFPVSLEQLSLAHHQNCRSADTGWGFMCIRKYC